MKRCVILFLSVALLCGPVYGQSNSTTAKYYERGLRNWFDAFSGHSKSTELIIFPTLLPIAPELTSNDAMVAQRAILELSDTIPNPSAIYSSSGRKTYDIYRTILDNRAPEYQVLSEGEQRRLSRAEYVLLDRRCEIIKFINRLLGKTPHRERSRKYSQYLEVATRYASLETQLLNEHSPPRREALNSEIKKTLQEWKHRGSKDQVESALTEVREVASNNPERFWAEVISQFRNNISSVNGVDMPLTRLYPSVAEWAQSSTWMQWHSDNSAASLMLVSIRRKWMNLDVLTTRTWSWSDGIYQQGQVLISDGDGLCPGSQGGGLMSVLPDQLLIAKNMTTYGQLVCGNEPVIVGVVCKVLPRLPAKQDSDLHGER